MKKFYRAFEERFRGTKKEVKKKVSIYLDLIKNFKDKNILDLGCGRGEFLELLKENNFKNLYGVDINKEMTKEINKDIHIYNDDVINFLKNQKENSFSIISSFHLIEHIDFDSLFILVKESFRILDENGILILETPNPENIKVACENFYLDPTHKNPLPPEFLKFLLEYFGFYPRILRLNNPPINNTIKDVIENVSPDYAIVGFKNPKMINEDFFNRGIHLDFVESAFENRLKNLEQRMTNLEIDKLIAENFHLKALNKHLNYEKEQLNKHIDLIEEENKKLKNHIEYMNNEQKRILKEAENKENKLKNHIKLIENENNNLKNHNQYIETLYLDVVNSKSWKITRPLRDVTNFFRQKKREKIIQVVNKEENINIELSKRSEEIYKKLKKEIKGKK